MNRSAPATAGSSPGVITSGLDGQGAASFLTSGTDDLTIGLTGRGEAALAELFGAADLTLPADLTRIDEDAFAGTAARVVYVPDGCEAIGSRAFRGCGELKSIRIPENCALGEQVFDGCGTVCVYARPGSAVESYCAGKEGLIFVPWTE